MVRAQRCGTQLTLFRGIEESIISFKKSAPLSSLLFIDIRTCLLHLFPLSTMETSIKSLFRLNVAQAPPDEPLASMISLSSDGYLEFAPNDIENPKNWPKARRWYFSTVAILLVVNATMASSAPSGASRGISAEFHISEEATNVVITMFLLGYCFGPLIFAPLSEFYGRRLVFLGTFTLFIAFNFLCAFAPNFAALLIGRLLTGSFAGASQTNAPGVLADLWEARERGNAMSLFSCMCFVGPAIGPMLAGFLQLNKNWRWSFYVVLWLGAPTWLAMLTLPETYPSVILLRKARRIRANPPDPSFALVQTREEAQGRSLKRNFAIALARPWSILFDPISFLCAIYIAVVFSLLYMLFIIYPIVFQEKRHWNSGVGQLPLIGIVVGSAIGSLICYVYSLFEKAEHSPEDRLPIAMGGGVLFTVTVFWFSWTAEYDSIHWSVPTLAGTLLSTSLSLVIIGYLNYITDTYLQYTASAMAVNTIIRSGTAAAAPLFTSQMFRALGVGAGGSVIGGVAAVLTPVPFIFYRYGRLIRSKSKFSRVSVKTEDAVEPNEPSETPRQGVTKVPQDQDEASQTSTEPKC